MDDKFLSLNEIDAAKDVDFVTVPVPEWGGALRFGSVSAESAIVFVEILGGSVEKESRADATWNLIAQCMVDGEGNRLVKTDEDRKKVVATLKRKDVRITDRIIDAVYKLNGIRLSTPEEAPKNDSGEAAPASSPIALPEAVAV